MSDLWCEGRDCSASNPGHFIKCGGCAKRRCVTCGEPCDCEPDGPSEEPE